MEEYTYKKDTDLEAVVAGSPSKAKKRWVPAKMGFSSKQLVIAVLMAVLIAVSTYYVTHAYLTWVNDRNNSFTVGQTVIEIIETYEPPEKLEPGITIKKAPKAKNTGNLDCYIRMRADFSSNIAREFCEDLVIDLVNWDDSRVNIDGYYYYKHLVPVGGETTPLFSEIVIREFRSDNVTPVTVSDLTSFDLSLYAEAKQQVDENPNPADYWFVWGLS